MSVSPDRHQLKGYDNVANSSSLPYRVAFIGGLHQRHLPDVPPGSSAGLDDVTETPAYAVISDEPATICRPPVKSASPPPLPPPLCPRVLYSSTDVSVTPPAGVRLGGEYTVTFGNDRHCDTALPPNIIEIPRENLVFVEKMGISATTEVRQETGLLLR